MRHSGYSILFMRDDMDVKSLRVGPRRLRVLLWSGVALGIVVLVALAVGVWSFIGYRTLLAERNGLEASLAEAKVAAERADNIAMLRRDAADGKTPPPAAKSGSARIAAVAPGRVFAKIDSHGVRVDNFRAQLSAGALEIAFDLNNTTASQAAGDVRLLLLRNDGGLLALAPANSADLTYQITRFKRVNVRLGLPQGLTRPEILGVRVEVRNTKGVVTFGETFAVGG